MKNTKTHLNNHPERINSIAKPILKSVPAAANIWKYRKQGDREYRLNLVTGWTKLTTIDKALSSMKRC